MKVAILHDFIRTTGGTERILVSFLKIFPEASVCTLVADKKIIKELNINNKIIQQSFIGHLPIINDKTSLIQILSPLLWRLFNLRKFDLIISISSYGLSNIINTGRIPHIQYILSIPKNLFYSQNYLSFQKIFPFHLVYSKLYQNGLKRTPYILTDSIFMKEKLKNLFGVTAKVIYPPVFIPEKLPAKSKKEYYIYVGRLDKTKSIDMAIIACNKLKLPLLIIGTGSEQENLEKIAGPTIKFLGFIPDKKLPYYYQKAKACIFCAKEEEFGIAPIEAMANGIPIIAYYGGGVKETLEEEITCNFFYHHKVEALIDVLRKYNYSGIDPETLYMKALKFSGIKFEHSFRKYVNTVIKRNNYF